MALSDIAHLPSLAKESCKETLRRTLASMGLQVSRVRNPYSFLRHFGFETIIDVGANRGQFASAAQCLFPRATIHCIEPLPNESHRLNKLWSNNDLVYVHPIALGDHIGSTKFHINRFSASSSVLPLDQEHITAFPFSYSTTESVVPVTTLDNWAYERNLESPILVKIDVQGYEDRVIQGGLTTLSKTDALLVELSFKRLYEGQSSFEKIHSLLKHVGLRFCGCLNNLLHPTTNEVLQADGIFLRDLSHREVSAEREFKDQAKVAIGTA